MNRIVKTFKRAFQKMLLKNWDTIYVFVDIHETSMKPTWTVEMSTEFYPKSLETLQLMSNHKNIKLILWSSSLPETNLKYKELFASHNIHFSAINSNPFEKSTVYADFDTKPYISVGLDDKFGFSFEEDWPALYDYFLFQLLEDYNPIIVDIF